MYEVWIKTYQEGKELFFRGSSKDCKKVKLLLKESRTYEQGVLVYINEEWVPKFKTFEDVVTDEEGLGYYHKQIVAGTYKRWGRVIKYEED